MSDLWQEKDNKNISLYEKKSGEKHQAFFNNVLQFHKVVSLYLPSQGKDR